jgi:predicted O-linked N-acetylglucosamine transferase (SPINDLY family)
MQIALEHHQRGRRAAAEAICREVLDQVPDHAQALNLSGILASQAGDLDRAAALLGRAVVAQPGVAEYHHNLAEVYLASGRWDEAIASARRAIGLKPDLAAAHLTLGAALHRSGRYQEAIAAMRGTIGLRPDYAEAYNNLGVALLKVGSVTEAIAALRRALELRPDLAEAETTLGDALRLKGRLEEAIAAHRHAIGLKPDHGEAHYNLGVALFASGRSEEAVACLRKALELEPDSINAQTTLATVLGWEGKTAEARATLERALASRPSDALRVRLALLLPVIYQSADELERERSRLEESILRLEAEVRSIKDPVDDVGSTTFYMAYQGKNDRDLLARLAATYRRAVPGLGFVAPHCRGAASGRPIRVGFLSSFFHRHSIGKLNLGFVRNLSRDHFHVTVLRFPGPDDDLSRSFQECADRVVTLPRRLDAAREWIAAEQLDVLYYTDIGMDPWTYFLAHARLAPVQCAAWGHPVTTGIPTIDYFLSSVHLEPEDGAEHYTEELVRFERINTYYYEPRRTGPAKGRSALGLADDATLYVCSQSLFKIRPDFDGLLGAILRGDPRGRVVLIASPCAHWTGLLIDRFRRSIPDCAERVVFLSPLSQEDFLELQALADVLLDTTGFGGGNTSYEAFAFGTPIVTRAGRFLRDRITYACYRQMGVLDCIAESDADYVRIALRLGQDREWRDEVRARILARKHLLYEDAGAVRELEQFLLRALERVRVRVRAEPAAIEEALQTALEHHRAGRLAEAEALYRRVLAESPDDIEALHLLGVLAGQSGHLDAAIDLIGRAVARSPTVPEYHNNVGEAYRRTGCWDAAVHHLERAIELKPGYADAHNNLGSALKGAGRLDEAIAAYQRAIALDPASADAQSNLGAALFETGRREEAIDACRRAIALEGDHADAHINLAIALEATGRRDEAIAAYRRAVALRPGHATLHVRLADALGVQGPIE